MTIWDCRTHVRMTSMTSSVERTDLDFKISVALLEIISMTIPSHPLIQEGHLSVTGERMCTKYW